MSSLYQNNLKLLFARNPGDQARLEAFLQEAKPLDKSPRTAELVPPLAPREYSVKLALLFGYLHKGSLAQIMKDPVLRELQGVYIVENNPDVVKYSLETEDWTMLLSDVNSHILLGLTLDQFQPTFHRSFANPILSSCYQALLVTSHPSLSEAELEFYKQVPDTFRQAVVHYTNNLGHMEDYYEGLRATAANTPLLRSCPGIHELHNISTKPAVLVGAGPSLDRDIELLKQHQEYFTIIVADAAVKKLVEAGIKADYAVSIERGNELQVKFWDGLANYPKDILPELVAFPVVHEKSFEAYPGNIRIVYRTYAYYTGFEQALPKGILHSYASCMHLGLRLAHHLGCPGYVLLGCDMCYEEIEPGQFRSHAGGLSYEEWGVGQSQKEFEDSMEATFKPFQVVQAYSGKSVLTHRVYRNFCSQWGMEALTELFKGRIVQCADSPPILGVPYRPFKEVCEAVTAQPIGSLSKPAYKAISKPAPPYPVWSQNLRGYARRSAELFNYLKNLTETLTSDDSAMQQAAQDLEVVVVYLRDVLQPEIFYSNNVVQCSTREYYTAWNRIHMFSFDMSQDSYEARLRRIQAIIDLLLVINKSATMIADAYEEAWK